MEYERVCHSVMVTDSWAKLGIEGGDFIQPKSGLAKEQRSTY